VNVKILQNLALAVL